MHKGFWTIGNILNFYEYNEQDRSYTLINNQTDESVNLYSAFSTYMKIKVKINNKNLTTSKASAFNSFAGNMNYGTDDSLMEDYEAGRFLVNVTEDDLDYILLEETNTYKFKLKDEFKQRYSNNKSVYLNIKINLEKLNMSYGGFEIDENSNFVIYKITDTNGNNLIPVGGDLCLIF